MITTGYPLVKILPATAGKIANYFVSLVRVIFYRQLLVKLPVKPASTAGCSFSTENLVKLRVLPATAGKKTIT